MNAQMDHGESQAFHLEKKMQEANVGDEDRFLPPIILQYWHTMLRWRLVLLGIIGVAVVIGLVVTLLTSPLYTAKAEIEISRQQKRVTNVAGLEAQGQPQELEFYATQYALLKSVSLVNRVSKTLNLSDNVEFFKAHGKAIPGTKQERDRLAESLLIKNVSIDPIRTSRLVDVSYTSRSPALSAKIANAWVREFIGATTDREYDSTAQARKFLEERLAALRIKMQISERNAVEFAMNNNIVALETTRDSDGRTETQRTLSSADLEMLNNALIAARSDRIAAEARAKNGIAEVSADVLANQALGAMRQRRAEVSAEYAKILSQYEPGYATARALKKQLDELDASIQRDTAKFGLERRQSYLQALAREKDLQNQVTAAKKNLDKQNRDSIQYNIFQRDADTNKQLYDGLLQRYKEIAEAGSVGASNIAIVDYARAPDRPSAPKLIVNLTVSLFAGIFVAAASVFALEQIDEGIRSPGDVWNLLKLPLLGNVPLSNHSPVEALADPKSSVTEAYLSIRSNLAFSTNHGLPKSIALTSAQPAEGKSTSALAIAEIIGRTSKSVVLIDADLRNPSVHTLAGVRNDGGLSNLLTGENDVFAYLQPGNKRGLKILPSGPLPPNPAELLSSDRLGYIVKALLEHFDHVVIDCPPVLGLADAPLVCRAVEGCVFVAEPGRSPLRGIRAALHRLNFVGARMLGVIITKIDINRQHYGYSYGYGYGYGSNKYGYGYGYGYSYGSAAERDD